MEPPLPRWWWWCYVHRAADAIVRSTSQMIVNDLLFCNPLQQPTSRPARSSAMIYLSTFCLVYLFIIFFYISLTSFISFISFTMDRLRGRLVSWVKSELSSRHTALYPLNGSFKCIDMRRCSCRCCIALIKYQTSHI